MTRASDTPSGAAPSVGTAARDATDNPTRYAILDANNREAVVGDPGYLFHETLPEAARWCDTLNRSLWAKGKPYRVVGFYSQDEVAALKKRLDDTATAMRDFREGMFEAYKGRDEYWAELERASAALGEGPYSSIIEHIQALQRSLAEREAECERLRNVLGEALTAASNGIACVNEDDDRVLMEIDWMHEAYDAIHHGASAAVATAAREPQNEGSNP